MLISYIHDVVKKLGYDYMNRWDLKKLEKHSEPYVISEITNNFKFNYLHSFGAHSSLHILTDMMAHTLKTEAYSI